jgi:hypothetical protein
MRPKITTMGSRLRKANLRAIKELDQIRQAVTSATVGNQREEMGGMMRRLIAEILPAGEGKYPGRPKGTP